MQDIDFDEIDRAVNSVSKATPAEPTTVPSDDAVTVSVSPRPSTAATAPRPSSGRFMDVVHPSTDMRSSGRSTDRSEELAVPERSEPREQEAPAELPKITEPTSGSDWPDPLDFHGFKDDEPEKEEPAAPTAEEEVATPLESPFISAKVEKRPLGAFSNTEPAAEQEAAPEASDEATDEKPATEEDTVAPAAEEAVEAPVEAPVLEETPAEPAPVSEEPSNIPTSITQQYKEQPSTDDNPSGAIYDTESYHAPLAHAPKKKSGALVIVWILSLILVGGGIGAAAYFFVLPML